MKFVEAEEFFHLSERFPVIDVRAEAEYKQGHIPNAINIPLFNDEERHKIGIIYKQIGKEKALLKGLEIIGPKMRPIVEQVIKIAPNRNVLIHCWRGGMRSKSFAQLLGFCGFSVTVLNGGYKSFRQLVLNEFDKDRKLIILGGKTGSGKTHILNEIKKLGEQVIDLEALAQHKGSAFGGYNQPKDLSVEHFQNLLASELLKTDKTKNLWLEDESRSIGQVNIPNSLWDKMRKAPIIFLEVPIDIRISNIINDYSDYPKDKVIASINKISKKLGGLDTKIALEALEQNNINKLCNLMLNYYDKSYLFALNKRENPKIKKIDIDFNDYKEISKSLIKVDFGFD